MQVSLHVGAVNHSWRVWWEVGHEDFRFQISERAWSRDVCSNSSLALACSTSSCKQNSSVLASLSSRSSSAMALLIFAWVIFCASCSRFSAWLRLDWAQRTKYVENVI